MVLKAKYYSESQKKKIYVCVIPMCVILSSSLFSMFELFSVKSE